jgi:hypothetical protein
MLPDYARKAELLKKKAEMEKEIAKLQEAEDHIATLPLNCRVVEMMHSLHCHLDHTAGCGYFYESWDDPKDCKKRLIKQADTLIARVGEHLMANLSFEKPISDDLILKTIEVCQERFW